MEDRYNVYFAGEVQAGCDVASVRDKLAKLFNADAQTLDKLFSGKAQLIKRDCDQVTATKYWEAIERAGAVPVIKVSDGMTATSQPTPPRAMTAAEKIAALAAAPDANPYSAKASGSSPHAVPQQTPTEPGGLLLAPPGTEVLRVDERAQAVTHEVDTSGIALDNTATRLSDAPPPPPAAPDTQHLSMSAVGERIPNLPTMATPLSPAIDGLALSAPGTDFSDCASPEPVALPLDLSALALAPAGGTLLEEQYRSRAQPAAPPTDHLALEQ